MLRRTNGIMHTAVGARVSDDSELTYVEGGSSSMAEHDVAHGIHRNAPVVPGADLPNASGGLCPLAGRERTWGRRDEAAAVVPMMTPLRVP
jgi:hypothetical protein